MKKQTLKNKRVLVTGVTGFIGSALATELTKQGAKVIGVSRTVKSKTIHPVDITDFKATSTFIKKQKIQVCYHLAGEAVVESGQTNPYETFITNTQGTLNLLEAARVYDLEKIIIASSSHVYGKNVVPYKEYYPPKPSRPYETSKTCTDLIAQSYADTFSLPVMIGRFVNVFGPGDLHFTRLIPKTIHYILENRNPEMWGGSAIREYLYLDDAVSAYLELGKVDISHIGRNRIFNFGSGNIYSVKEVIEKIISVSGSSLKIVKVPEKRGLEISRQYVSSLKAKRVLDWEARVDLETGLEKTIAWYRTSLGRK